MANFQANGFLIICGVFMFKSIANGCPLEPYCLRGPFGSTAGHYFSDYNTYSANNCGEITKIEAWTESYLKGLRLSYGPHGNWSAGIRGSACDDCEQFTENLAVDEYINKIYGVSGEPDGSTPRIVELTFYTNKGKMFSFGNSDVDLPVLFEAQGTVNGTSRMHWITGRSGGSIDLMTFYFKCDG